MGLEMTAILAVVVLFDRVAWGFRVGASHCAQVFIGAKFAGHPAELNSRTLECLLQRPLLVIASRDEGELLRRPGLC